MAQQTDSAMDKSLKTSPLVDTRSRRQKARELVTKISNKATGKAKTEVNTSDSHNRYSMPVTKSRNGVQDMLALDQTNTARFLFGDDENSAEAKSFLQMQSTKDNFPILLRGEQPQKVSHMSKQNRTITDRSF